MSTIYAYTSPARGHIYPLVPILAELLQRGHRVKVWALADELERLDALGLEAVPIDPEIESLQLDDWKGGNDLEQIENTFRTWTARGTHELDDLRGAIADERPDLMVTDINCFGAPALAEAEGLSWASFSPYFTLLPDPAVPPFGPGMKQLGGPLGRLRNAAIWKLMTAMLDRKALAGVNEVRTAAGAPPLETVAEQWTRPPLLLYMTVPELEYERPRWPGSFEFVGPANWEPPAERPEWLDSLDRPLVLVTASTEYQQDEQLISVALEALAGEDVFVAATSAGCEPTRFTVPANARVERFLPHGPILERADSVICHGGMGITQKALASGVPVCAVGWGRDQRESGRRVEAAGAGAYLPKKRLDPERLRAAWREARSRRAGAERIAAAMVAAPGPIGAADRLEDLIGSRPPAMAGGAP